MRIAYFDCFSGISGDMILGALIDAGLNFNILRKELEKLPLPKYEIEYQKIIKKNIACTKVNVISDNNKIDSFDEMIGLVEKSTLSDDIKQQINQILRRMLEAEAKVHRIEKVEEKTHLHELSSIDTLIDTAGAVIGFKVLGIDKVYSSPLNVGSGTIKIKHGILPVPAPATCELLKDIPIYSNGTKAELTTPTGAAIITTVATKFGYLPTMKVNTIGYGAGNLEFEHQPNLLRVIIGDSLESEYIEEDTVTLIETNIDDLNPEIYEYCFERLFEAGALDVYLTPIYMKKNRPAVILSVISSLEKVNGLINIIFKETTSTGIRLQEIRRKKLPRQTVEIETEFGKIQVKKVTFGDKTRIIPEYEVCKKIAKEKDIPLKEVYSKINFK